MESISINNPSELPVVASALKAFAKNERFFVFEGEMGAGKTTFIKAYCELLGVEDLVSSPTFSIVNEYRALHGQVYHFDFYRLKNIQEAFDIGYEDYFFSKAVCLVEWPSKVEAILPEQYIKVEILISGDNSRTFNFSLVRQ